jgi:hypothetical protein
MMSRMALVLRDARGLLQDMPLNDSRIFRRYQVEMTARHVNVKKRATSTSRRFPNGLVRIASAQHRDSRPGALASRRKSPDTTEA